MRLPQERVEWPLDGSIDLRHNAWSGGGATESRRHARRKQFITASGSTGRGLLRHRPRVGSYCSLPAALRQLDPDPSGRYGRCVCAGDLPHCAPPNSSGSSGGPKRHARHRKLLERQPQRLRATPKVSVFLSRQPHQTDDGLAGRRRGRRTDFGARRTLNALVTAGCERAQ